MKKFFSIAATIVVALLTTSCFEDTPSYVEYIVSRLATIETDASGRVSFACDYTGEVFKPENVTTVADLSKFHVEATDTRVMATLRIYQEYYGDSEVNVDELTVLPVNAVSNTSVDSTAVYQPLSGFNRLQVESSWAYPYGFVSKGYLSILPVTFSVKEPTLTLQPLGVQGDTLQFELLAQHARDEKNAMCTYKCYDLRTLADTAAAAADVKPVMKEMWSALQRHRTDSMVVNIRAMQEYGDTIRTVVVPTGYFRPEFVK